MTEETNTEQTSDSATEENVSEGQVIEDKPVDSINAGLADGSAPEFKWYVAHALTGHENKVSRALKEKIVNLNMTQYFSEILIPEETVVTNVNGKKRNIKKKFFPGYILIKMVMNDLTWHLVKSTDKITGFLGATKTQPSPLTEAEAMAMTNTETGGFKRSRAASNFSEGDSVKVVEGPFASFVGTIENVDDKGKLRVNVSIFGRPTPVELDFSQVEKV